jgi:hypothetical protein
MYLRSVFDELTNTLICGAKCRQWLDRGFFVHRWDVRAGQSLSLINQFVPDNDFHFAACALGYHIPVHVSITFFRNQDDMAETGACGNHRLNVHSASFSNEKIRFGFQEVRNEEIGSQVMWNKHRPKSVEGGSYTLTLGSVSETAEAAYQRCSKAVLQSWKGRPQRIAR